jgi:NAD(P)-dependent dehydrogenase (short-subunit alcohol dehydrogenase family)
MTPPLSPRSRTVLVTGAGKRLGREIALTLARAGWRVAVHHRHSRSEAEQTAADCSAAHPHGAPAMICHADLSMEASVRDLVPAVVAQFGALDAVVNSASVFEHDSAETVDVASFQMHWMANTAAPVLLAQALHQHVVGRGGQDGVVVNLLDQKLWNPNPDFFSYTLSKAALETANTLMAQAFSPQLRVVGVAPGLTLTSHMLSDEKFAELHRQSPLGRSSTPEDVAATVAFALSNRSITGTTLLVDGGQHLMRFERDFSHM